MGYDVELVDSSAKKDANICPHCKLILEEPFQTDEGVRLCKSCLLEIKSKSGGVCSCCKVTVLDGQVDYYSDKAAQREVNAILVFCRYKRFGCPWKDKLQGYTTHIEGCEFAGVSCPNDGCNEMVLSSQLKDHLSKCQYRSVQCSHCNEEMIAKDLEAHHSSVCRMYPVVCVRCEETVSHRYMMDNHLLNDCRLEECLVCTDLVERSSSKNISVPSSTSAATSSTADTTTDEVTIATSKSQPTSTPSTTNKKSQPRSKQKTSKKSEKSSTIAPSEEMPITSSTEIAVVDKGEKGGGREGGKWRDLHLEEPMTVFRHVQTLATQQRQLRTDFKTFSETTEVKLSEAGGQRSHDNAEMNEGMRELVKQLEYQVKTFSEEAETERRRRIDLEKKLDRMGRELDETVRNTNKALEKSEHNTREMDTVRKSVTSGVVGAGAMVKSGRSGKMSSSGGGWDVGGRVEDRVMMLEQRTEQQERETSTLKVNVSELELQLQASLASTHNGSFLWRIPEVARRRRDAIDERITSIYSPPFYTGRNGYKMCIRAYLNGDGIGYKTHFSVFFVLMRGEFDPLLKWPFEYKVSLILVDQEHRKHIVQTFKPTAESSSFKRPTSDMNVASGCPQFSKLSVLDDVSYTKDDVIYLKCIIDTSRIFHP